MKDLRKLIAEEWQDEDGYWIGLVPGYMDGTNPQCHQIHEDTKAEAYVTLESVVPCNCPEHKVLSKDEVFNLHGSWRISLNGIVPVTTWRMRGPAEAQLDLLKKGYSILGKDGIIRHPGAKEDKAGSR